MPHVYSKKFLKFLHSIQESKGCLVLSTGSRWRVSELSKPIFDNLVERLDRVENPGEVIHLALHTISLCQALNLDNEANALMRIVNYDTRSAAAKVPNRDR